MKSFVNRVSSSIILLSVYLITFGETFDNYNCSCNGEIDDTNGGECRTTWNYMPWCYVDASSGCNDTLIWTGTDGLQHTSSYQACENVIKDCSCNGEIDDTNGGECRTTWNYMPWCYVDPSSGCNDTLILTGTDGLQHTSSYQACENVIKDIPTAAASSSTCPHTDKYQECNKWQKPYCSTGRWVAWMLTNCAATCRCPATRCLYTDAWQYSRDWSCGRWKDDCFSGEWADWMQWNCLATCYCTANTH